MLVILSYIFYFIAATVSPLQRRQLAKINKDTTNKEQISFLFKITFIIIILSLFLPFFSPLYINGNIWYLTLLGIICGVFGGITYISSFVAQKNVEAGITVLVLNIYTPITIILSTFFLHERLNFTQILGTILLIIAIFIVSKKHQVGGFKFDKYFWLMVLSGVSLAIYLVAERLLIRTTGFSAGSMLSWWFQFIFLGLLVLVIQSKDRYSKKDIVVTGVLRFLQNLSWVILLVVVGNLSIVSSITTFKVVIMFIAAAIFLNERDNLSRKIVGSIVALVGLLLI